MIHRFRVIWFESRKKIILYYYYLLFLIPTFSLDINADQTAEQIELKIIQDVDIVRVTCASTFI